MLMRTSSSCIEFDLDVFRDCGQLCGTCIFVLKAPVPIVGLKGAPTRAAIEALRCGVFGNVDEFTVVGSEPRVERRAGIEEGG